MHIFPKPYRMNSRFSKHMKLPADYWHATSLMTSIAYLHTSPSATNAWYSTQYTALAGISILYYEYLLTISMEIERFWTRGMSWAAILFFLNRYLVLIGEAPTLWEYFWSSQDIAWDEHVCSSLVHFHEYFSVFVQLVSGVMLIMRTYAFYGQNRKILILLCATAIACTSVGCWSVLTGASSSQNNQLLFPGCSYAVGRTEATHLLIAWAGVLLFDSVIFVLTLYKAIDSSLVAQSSLVSRLVKDGAMYFGIMTLANIFNVSTFAVAEPVSRGFGTSLANILSSTLISRLYLNLRDPKLDHIGQEHTIGLVTTVGPFTAATDSGAGVFSTILLEEESIELSTIQDARDGEP